MLGIHDPWIVTAYLACVLSAVLCIVYGIYNWNRGGDKEAEEFGEEAKWESDELKVEEKL